MLKSPDRHPTKRPAPRRSSVRLQTERLEDRTVLSAVAVTPEFKLLPNDLEAGDNAGFAVSIDGDTAVVGAAYDGPNQTGAAYVFVRSGDEWVQKAKLTASDAQEGDRFGNGVAIDGDTILVGAPGQYPFDRPGSAYIFARHQGVWTEQAILVPSGSETGDFFGAFVALDDKTAVVSAFSDGTDGIFAGAAYAFRQKGQQWVEQVNFATLVDNTDFDFFGSWVAIDGNTTIVTAQGANSGQGEAHFFERRGQSWVHQVEVSASDGAPGDFFGWMADIDGDTAVIGAPYDDDRTGSAYVFKRKGNHWTEQEKLTASDGQPNDGFGSQVAISGNHILVSQGVFPPPRGSVYLFTRDGGDWQEVIRFIADDTAEGDFFGTGLDLDGDTAIIGAYRADVDGKVDSGAAYIFSLDVIFGEDDDDDD